MKKLLASIIMATVLTGCNFFGESVKTKNPEPVFSFTQSVQVQSGFYKGVVGYVTNYKYCLDDNDKLTICYTVIADFGLIQVPLERSIYEADLVAVEREQ